MHIKIVLSSLIIVGCVLLFAESEFTKPSAREMRKTSVQHDNACDECLKLIDGVFEQVCTVQEKLGAVAGRFYKTLRSCAVDDKPAIMSQECKKLQEFNATLKSLKKQLQDVEMALEKALANEALAA